MGAIPVRFVYLTSIAADIFRDPRLHGSWAPSTTTPMQVTTGEDGCPVFEVTVDIDDSLVGAELRWGVILDAPWRTNLWAIATEVGDGGSADLCRSFRLQPPGGCAPQDERYYLTHCRRLGVQKRFWRGAAPAAQFSVWAPNARLVELVFGKFGRRSDERGGYIADDGSGSEGPALPMTRDREGVWHTDPSAPELADFRRFDHRLYMFRITKDDGQVAYRTDLYSRCQVGKGRVNPEGRPYTGHFTELDGSVSCSVVIDPDTVTRRFSEPDWPESEFMPVEEFWRDEYDRSRPLPMRVEDLVLYELHVGSLGFGEGRPGNFGDALAFLDHLVDLGVNAIELLPVAQFEGDEGWGYGTSHYLAMEFTAGGRDQLKYLVKACHQRGIAVILDVVYNHYKQERADRAEWMYDANAHDRNIYYWYEGSPRDYLDPMGGYIDNDSTGYAPRYDEEMVRKLFISSAVSLVTEFHVDGLRVDQTTSMHAYNRLHADGRPVGRANQFGQKVLRELSRTLRMVNPDVILIAEDHSEWYQVTEDVEQGGLGFDAAWYAQFYHHLVGDEADRGVQDARLIMASGYGDDRPLAMDYFAGALAYSGHKKVVYHESHDEAGNARGTHRTLVTAVNGAPLVGETRRFAEARCRFAFGLTMLSAGTPMFLMGEEVGATRDLLYNRVAEGKVDFAGERAGAGARMFFYYRDMIKLRLERKALRSREIEILSTDRERRLVSFLRWHGPDALLVVATLSNRPLRDIVLDHPRLGDADWKEIFSSDAAFYGGDGVGNHGSTLRSERGRLRLTVPANGIVVFVRASAPP
ncbi:alpha-amylase family glycosyl hydrolase [Sorangium sp. So ce291]|uniref:alpha-amylase family glycosyl hydrolase n=1 Tax=Sorangium sp. So ce291 TaxID=3133294 RepID=UPI003F611B23